MNPSSAQTDPIVQPPQSEVSAEVLTTLAQISEEVNASLDLDEVLARTAALIKKHIDYEIFGVLLLDESAGTLKHRFLIGYSRDLAANLVIPRSEEHTSELQSRGQLVCRLLLEKK